jgi:hypothetical protein
MKTADETKDIAELRVRLWRNGYHPLPLEGKVPPMKGWQNKFNANPKEIALWSKSYNLAHNTGVLTGDTPCLDIDITDEAAAEDVEHLACDCFGNYGRFLVRTGKAPKRAIFFQTDQPFKKLLISLTAPNGAAHKIEFLCDGQQAVVDGVHPETGRPYVCRGGTLADVRHDELPGITEESARDFLAQAAELLVREHGYKVEDTTKSDNADGPADDMPRADWAALMAKILAGKDLHDSICRLAASHAAAGLPQNASGRTIQAVLLASLVPHDERWQARFKEVPRAVKSAYAKFGAVMKPVTKDEETLTADVLMAKVFEPIKSIVPGVFVEGLTLFAGKPKIGKSWLLLHAGIAVATNGFTLGEVHCKEGDVLYCALEDNERRLKSRLGKLLGSQPPPKRLHLRTKLPRLADGGLAIITEWIKSVLDPRLIMIDTLAMVRAPKGKTQTDYDADYNAVLVLRDLAAQYGIAIVVVHHLRKAEADDPFDTISGTLGLTGAPDSVVVLKRDTSGEFTLHGRGRDVMEIEKALTFNRNACIWTMIGEVREVRLTGERKAILTAMQEIGEPASPVDIAAMARLKPTSVRHLLLRLAKDGLVLRENYGRYQLSNSAAGGIQ